MATPYELRFSYYSAAKEHLLAQYYAEFNQAQVEADKGKSVEYPHFPSTGEIFALAEEIKAFSEKK